MKFEYDTDPNVRLIDAVQRNTPLVRDVCMSLEGLARALARVGNHAVADELRDAIEPLMQSACQVNRSFGADLRDQCSHSEMMAGNMLKAVLIGALGPAQTIEARSDETAQQAEEIQP